MTSVFDHNYNKNNISFGVSFVCWNGYNTWHTYIKQPTFSNLKEEILNNPYYALTLYQWTVILNEYNIFYLKYLHFWHTIYCQYLLNLILLILLTSITYNEYIILY